LVLRPQFLKPQNQNRIRARPRPQKWFKIKTSVKDYITGAQCSAKEEMRNKILYFSISKCVERSNI